MTDFLQPISKLASIVRAVEPCEDIGVPGEVQWIALTDLVVDSRYQRSVERASERNIRDIVEGFRWEKFEPLIVAPSQDWPGKFCVIDGQHRAIAAWHVPYVTSVPAVVHQLSPREQARAFRDVNRNRTKIGPLHIYRAGLISGDPAAIGVQAVTSAAGVEVAPYNLSKANMKPHQLVCVNAVSKSLKRSGFDAVSRALLSLKLAAKGSEVSIMSSWAVQVVSICCAANRELSTDEMVEALGSVDLDTEIKDRATELSPTPAKKMATAAEILARQARKLERVAA